MNNKKIGIITQYYNSHNYGGLLQAYALVEAIKDLGYDVEQISYDSSKDDFSNVFLSSSKSKTSYRRFYLSKIKNIIKSFLNLLISRNIKKRYIKMDNFSRKISHSSVVYDKNTVNKISNLYRQFVVGSDQVWNPQFYSPVYFCEFLNQDEKKCISYAASVSQNHLTEKQKKLYKEHLRKFTAISLRENNTDIIQELTNNKVEWVLDPTLLLKKKQWDNVASPQLINEPYIFCYFLGDDSTERKLAEKFAKIKNLKLVTIPYLAGDFNFKDFNFSGKKIKSAGPEDFVSLIKYADYIFTDSFHACVFSCIYEKHFFAFQRAGMKGMSTRIETLLSLFGNSNRFCDRSERQTIEYLLLDTNNDEYNSEKFEKKLFESIEFLKKYLFDKRK